MEINLLNVLNELKGPFQPRCFCDSMTNSMTSFAFCLFSGRQRNWKYWFLLLDIYLRCTIRLISEVSLRQMKSASMWQILNGKSWVKSTSPLIFVFFLSSKLGKKLNFPLSMGCFHGTFKIRTKWLVKSSTEARPLSHYPKNSLCPFKSVQVLHLGPASIHALQHQAALEVMLLQETWHTVTKKNRNARCFLVESPASFVPLATARIAVLILRHLL